MALCRPKKVAALLDAAGPDAIHIATEGPLGLAARRYCRRRCLPFTTSFHTRFPEYVHARWRVPIQFGYRFLRWFHGRATRTMVATPSVEAELREQGFRNLVRWSRGVDLSLFHPRNEEFLTLPRPVCLFVGRVAVEKGIGDFLRLDLPGSKVVIGDGPHLPALRQAYPDVHFLGARFGEDLARHYAAADVFVFPSRTDTFGLVMLEALASGVPVAAFPVPGPIDVIGASAAGILDDDLAAAVHRALDVPAHICTEHAARFTWQASTQQFVGNLAPFRA